MRFLALVMAGFFLLAGCDSTQGSTEVPSTGNMTASEVLAQRPDADLFQWNGIVYMHAGDIDWVQQRELTSRDKIGTIAKQYRDGIAFEDGMATKLPVGAELYEPSNRGGPILLVKANGEEIRYLGLIEG